MSFAKSTNYLKVIFPATRGTRVNKPNNNKREHDYTTNLLLIKNNSRVWKWCSDVWWQFPSKQINYPTLAKGLSESIHISVQYIHNLATKTGNCIIQVSELKSPLPPSLQTNIWGKPTSLILTLVLKKKTMKLKDDPEYIKIPYYLCRYAT